SGSNETVEDVFIKATNRATGLTLKTQTNQRGEYRLALQAPEVYTITYSKAGYINTNKKVTITSQTDKSLLGVLSFKKSYSAGTGFGGEVVANIDDVEDRDDEVIPELDIPQGRGELDDYDENATPKGYAVQVAAYFDSREIKIGEYETLQDIGNVYKMKEGKAEKVRVGIFPTKKEAEDARKVISKKGYAKAFIVAEEGRQNFALTLQEEEPETKPEPVADNPKVDLKVRVATFRSTKRFDESKLEEIGEIEKINKGQFTIVLLSGFETELAAKIAMEKVYEMGYKDTHLVIEDGKNLKRVK
ncbi:MAG: carboxypeptidase regulatory-like domain-containing protein, partial [Saprospiraceae bacterium]